MKKLIKNIFLLPIVLLVDIFKSKRLFLAKLGYLLLLLFFFAAIWLDAYKNIYSLIKTGSFSVGISDKPLKVSVNGESMLPRITDGSEVELYSPKKYNIQRGDIVSFSNIETSNRYFIKRVVGLPEENVIIKNGYVFINGKILKENYLPEDIPTLGNTFITECNLYTIPENQYMVLGDNRIVSMDSRVIGFVEKNSIEGVIKENSPEIFLDNNAEKNITKINIDNNSLLEKINEERVNEGKNLLILSGNLSEIADIRASSIKEFFNDWKNKSSSVEKIAEEKKYKYLTVHEFVTFGYLDEKSIVGQILDSFVDESEFLSYKYQEIGIGQSEVSVNQCTFPVVSIIISQTSIN